MTIAITLSALTGIAIGFRSNIYMVVLAVLLAAATFAVISTTQSEQSWSIATGLVLSAVALQVGYLCASFAVSMREAPIADPVDVSTARAEPFPSRGSLSA